MVNMPAHSRIVRGELKILLQLGEMLPSAKIPGGRAKRIQRRGRNRQTGAAMTLSPRKVVTFKCSGVLRAAMNEEGD